MPDARETHTPEIAVMLMNGPCAEARVLLIGDVREGSVFDVPTSDMTGMETYAVVRLFEAECADCDLKHRKGIARHKPRIAA